MRDATSVTSTTQDGSRLLLRPANEGKKSRGGSIFLYTPRGELKQQREAGGDYHKDLLRGGGGRKNFNVKKVRALAEPPAPRKKGANEIQSSRFQLRVIEIC